VAFLTDRVIQVGSATSYALATPSAYMILHDSVFIKNEQPTILRSSGTILHLGTLTQFSKTQSDDVFMRYCKLSAILTLLCIPNWQMGITFSRRHHGGRVELE